LRRKKSLDSNFRLGSKRFVRLATQICKLTAAQRDWREFRIAQKQAVNATMRRCRKFGRLA
jgi:hypothetical protein